MRIEPSSLDHLVGTLNEGLGDWEPQRLASSVVAPVQLVHEFEFSQHRAELSNRRVETDSDFPKHAHLQEAGAGWVRIDHGEC